MSTIIAFISQKGGVGKSTLARALAHEASHKKLKVLLADCDPQQATTLREAPKYDLTIIDGPARTSHATLEIAQVADLVTQPAGPSLDDLVPAVKEFHALVKAGVKKDKLVFALNRIATSAEETAAREYLTMAGYSVLLTPLLEKASYRQAQNQGLAITEVIYVEKKGYFAGTDQGVRGIVQKENIYLAEVLERMMTIYQKEVHKYNFQYKDNNHIRERESKNPRNSRKNKKTVAK
ncbi:38908_t:CDS:2 [Gigaspora margarita]|uniref:38908_t:CDS:1 n=1 Tax=Gigaspora margarita TaxID=4874 RepID=A0ABN7V1R4_GIGMA|nr:38908_t:CDS:2 [Gigaspora margarita]